MYKKRQDVFFGYGSNLYVGEDWARQRLVEWINQIINEENLNFSRADVQIKIVGATSKFPDIIIFDKNSKPICLIELKRPEFPLSAFVSDAQLKAVKARPQIPYFGTWNINKFDLWKTYDPVALRDEDLRVRPYSITRIVHISEITKGEVENKIKDFIRTFLKDLERIVYKKEIQLLPLINPDEFFIEGLRGIVDIFTPFFYEVVKENYRKDIKFKIKLDAWFVSQRWTPPSTDYDFERVARQFLYLLINKLLFYNTLRIRYKNIEEINISNVNNGQELKEQLQKYFEHARTVTEDYETVFGVNFIESVPVPDKITNDLSNFINGFSRYNFSKLEYKDIGHIFDRLIPDNERHKLGQYYTNSDVVDLINGFCVKNEDYKIADFGCGAGTFLVRAYGRLKGLNPKKSHEEILNQLFGVDISKFAAHLSVISLASRDLRKIENYPIIIANDFFNVSHVEKSNWWKIPIERMETLSGHKKRIDIPTLDTVVGNPPYTRQEELEDYIVGYKQKLQEVMRKDWGKDVKLGERAGIYAYFFLHGLRFLKDGGRFGYITSNSWLDVDYGKYLQEFFLKRCKIVAIIEPKERVFPDADINTVITILERCDDKKERENNLVKFVQLKIPLKELIKESEENKRFYLINKLVQQTEEIDKFYEDAKLRIYPKLQNELWDEGLDDKKNQYVGSKWGKYIRAPDVFFKILDKGKNLFVDFKNYAKIRRGYIPWPYEFYILDKDEIQKWGIEKRFLKPVFRSPKESDKILLEKNQFKKYILLVSLEKKQLKNTKIVKYIKWGEEEGYQKNISKELWYDLGQREQSEIIWVRTPFNKHCIYLNEPRLSVIDHVEITPLDNPEFYCALLNSTLYMLFREGGLYGRSTLGLGALKTEVMDIKQLPIIAPPKVNNKIINKIIQVFKFFSKRSIGTVFEEIGANSPEEVSFDKVKPDRRELDKIVMGEILGLTEEEQLEVYKSVIKLVKDRIERARNVEKRKKVDGADPEALAEGILREIDTSKLKKFPDDYLDDVEYEVKKVPEGEPKLGSDLKGFFVKVEDKRVNCSSSEEAQWIYYAILNDITSLKIPKNKKVMKDTVKEYSSNYKKIQNEVKIKLESYIPDRKLREKVKLLVDKKLFR